MSKANEALSDEEIADRGSRAVAFYMDKLASIFHPHVKLTLVVRNPDKDKADAYFSNEDNMHDVVAALKRMADDPQGNVGYVTKFGTADKHGAN